MLPEPTRDEVVATLAVKVDRAESCLTDLLTEVETWSQAHPVVIDRKDNDALGLVVGFASVDAQVPADWAVRFGEVLHNLRSALDHTVWHMSSAKSRSSRQIGFPVVADETRWGSEAVSQKIRGLSAAAQQYVRSVQPFTGHPHGATLVMLDDLWIADKHRSPLRVILVRRSGTLHVEPPPLRIVTHANVPLSNNVEMFRLQFEPNRIPDKLDLAGLQYDTALSDAVGGTDSVMWLAPIEFVRSVITDMLAIAEP